MTDMPDEIWLQGDSKQSAEVTWAQCKINDFDTKYIRADLVRSGLEAFHRLRSGGKAYGYGRLSSGDLPLYSKDQDIETVMKALGGQL
jgi:hypothetical protein